MKLSEQELRWLRLWEKRERQWPMTRWLGLLIGIVSAGCGILIFHGVLVGDFPEWGSLLFVPFVFFGMAGVWFGLVLSNWHGNVKLGLLLRLIREHEDKDAK